MFSIKINTFATDLFPGKYVNRLSNQKKQNTMKEKIGNNAGLVWSALAGSSAVNLKDVKKQTKLTEKDLYAALGWLAREEKVTFSEDAEGNIFVALV